MKRLGIVLGVLLVCSVNVRAYTLYWFTGAGIKKPAERIAKMYNRQHKNRVIVIAGGSGQVLNQMLEAKKGDIYTLVDSLFLHRAIRHNIVVRYRKILKLTPVFVVSKESRERIKTIFDLARANVKIAGGDKRAMCLGETFDEIMGKLPHRLASALQRNIVVRCLNVYQIVSYVQEGVVDAGIVLDKALIRSTHLPYIEIPEKYNVHRYGYLALIAYSRHKNAAENLYRFIVSHLDVYKNFGFNVLKSHDKIP